MTAFLRRLVYEIGNGRALANAHRGLQQHALVNARIEALGRRLAAAPEPGQRAAA